MSTSQVPAPTLPNGTPAFASPKKNRTNCTGTLNAVLEPVHRVWQPVLAFVEQPEVARSRAA